VDPSAQERLFAAEVSRARAAAKVTQEWVGRQVGLSRSKVSEVCNGRYLPTRETVALLVVALGMDRDRTLRLWQDASAARDVRRRHDRQLTQSVVGWERLPVLPVEAMSLLRAHITAAEELPYLLPGARRPSLSTVYVRQELGSGVEDVAGDRRIPRTRPLDGLAAGDLVVRRDGGRSEAFVRSAPPRVAVRTPGRPVREALDGHEHVLVTGGPGQGKSTLTLRLAADVATAWVGRDDDAETVTAGDPPLAEPVVPVRLPARILAARMGLPLPEALADAVSAEYGLMLDAPITAALLGGRVGGCRWLLLIDAVDEIADPHLRVRFVRMLAGWISKSSDRPYRLLVTSRPVESGGLGPLHHGAARFELQPFDTDALRRFADHWFGTASDASHRFLRQIRQARLDELVRVPLLATIAAIIFDQHRDRPLPDNQYGLYEEYLTYLASAHRWPDESGPFAGLIRRLRPALLEHLGATRYHADVSLVAAARDWMLEHTTAQQLPAGWPATLVAILRAVGPLVVRGDDLQFLHHSFAEHLAATERARRLPAPFEADHPTWAHTIHAAQHGLATKFARAILLHYTHIYPDQADHLVTWLHDNLSAYQRIAAELLALHAPASPAVMDTFLATARAWAKTATGIDILRQATGATHHPRLASWLRDLMHESDATWSARIDAATVLCTRLEDESSDAVRLLQTAMDDATLDIADRVTAAQGLAKIGSAHRTAAIRGLRRALRDSSSTGYTLRAAAIALADLGADCRAEAIEALRTALDDSTTPPQDEVQAAIGLAEIGFEFHHEAIARLRTIAQDTGVWLYSRTHAALALGDLGSIYLDQAADLLDDMVTDRSQTTWNRCRFAGALAELGPEYVPRAVDHLLAILAEPFITSQERYNAAGELAKAHPSYNTAAADHLRQVLADSGLHTNSRLWAARALAELGPTYHEEAARQFRHVATDPFAADWEGCDAAAKLASLGPRHRDEAIALLRLKLIDPTGDADIRIAAAGELAELGTEFHDEAATTLGLIMTDPSHADRDRADAAGKLAGLRTTAHRQTAEILQAILRNPTVSGAARRTAAHELAALGPAYRTEAAAGLHAVLWDDSCESIDRVNAARYLTELGQEYRADAAMGLRTMLNRSDASITYSMVASVLSELGAEFRAEAADTLRAIIANPTEEPDRRLAAAATLADLGQEHRDEVATAFHAILSTPATDAHCRQQAATSLLRYGTEQNTSTAAATLLSVLRDPTCRYWTRREAAQALAQQGGQYLVDAIDSLQTILADSATPDRDQAQLAEVLAALGDEPRKCAASHLRAMIANPGTRVAERMEAVWQLSRIDSTYRDEAVDYFAEILLDDAVSVTDRCTATDHLVRLDRGALARTIRILRLMLVSPLATPSDRLTLTEQLTELAAINRHERIQSVLSVAHDPTSTAHDRSQAISLLKRPKYAAYTTAVELERDLLNDHLAPIQARVAKPFTIHGTNTPLNAEKIVVLREARHAPELQAQQRLNALEQLAEFGPEARQEAVSALRQTIENPAASANLTYHALLAIGRINGGYRLQALALAESMASNATQHPRRRLAAARATVELGGSGGPATHVLQHVVQDPAVSDRDKMRAASALAQPGQPEHGAALTRLHALVHNPETNPYVRHLAAHDLVRWRPTERATTAEVLDQLAASRATPPAARWRIASALADLGEDYRDPAVRHLRLIANDAELPPSVRTGAANVLAGIHPQHLDEAADTLRAIAYPASLKPADRRHALITLGSLGRLYCDEAVAVLRHVLHDNTPTPTDRWRTADAMVQLRRDTVDEAAQVLCEIVRNPKTLWHVGQRAARLLTRLSPTCRHEARQILQNQRSR
jgi:hypothetical protein